MLLVGETQGLARPVHVPVARSRPRGALRRRSILRPSAATAISCAGSSGRPCDRLHDLSDGGLAVGLAEMAMAGRGSGPRSRRRRRSSMASSSARIRRAMW
jgi:hypothetical protein